MIETSDLFKAGKYAPPPRLTELLYRSIKPGENREGLLVKAKGRYMKDQEMLSKRVNYARVPKA